MFGLGKPLEEITPISVKTRSGSVGSMQPRLFAAPS